MVEQAKDAVGRGFGTIYFKVGIEEERDVDLVRRVREAATRAEHRPPPVAVAAAAEMPRCQVCGETRARLFDFLWLFSVVALMFSKPDRRVLCARHGGRRARFVLATNLISGNLGFGLFISPIYALANVKEARYGGAMNKVEAAVWLALGFIRYALIVWMLAWVVWYVIHF
jgi:hypothetical protein